jgi:hypothetical protein
MEAYVNIFSKKVKYVYHKIDDIGQNHIKTGSKHSFYVFSEFNYHKQNRGTEKSMPLSYFSYGYAELRHRKDKISDSDR